MAPSLWATKEQTEWLTKWMPVFIQRQAEKKLHQFWPAMIEAWFKNFPEELALNLPLASDKTSRLLTPDKLAALGISIEARRKVSHVFIAFDASKLTLFHRS
jgi:hypothetical protein